MTKRTAHLDLVDPNLGSTRFLARRTSALEARPDLKTLCPTCARPTTEHTLRQRRECRNAII